MAPRLPRVYIYLISSRNGYPVFVTHIKKLLHAIVFQNLSHGMNVHRETLESKRHVGTTYLV